MKYPTLVLVLVLALLVMPSVVLADVTHTGKAPNEAKLTWTEPTLAEDGQSLKQFQYSKPWYDVVGDGTTNWVSCLDAQGSEMQVAASSPNGGGAQSMLCLVEDHLDRDKFTVKFKIDSCNLVGCSAEWSIVDRVEFHVDLTTTEPPDSSTPERTKDLKVTVAQDVGTVILEIE